MITQYILVKRIRLQYNIKINIMVDPGWFKKLYGLLNINAKENAISTIIFAIQRNEK